MQQASKMVTDANAARVCSAAGIALVSNKLVTFNELRKGLQIAIREAEAAKAEAVFWDRALLGAKLVKAACDGAIGVLGELTGPWGKVVSAGYKVATPIAEAGGKAYAGQQPITGKTVTAVAGGALSAAAALAKAKSSAVGNVADKWVKNSPLVGAAEKKIWSSGVTSTVVQNAAETAKKLKTADQAGKLGRLYSDVAIDAINGNEAGVKKTVFLNQTADLMKLAADAGESMGAKNAKTFGSVVSAGKELISAGLSAADAIESYKNDSAAGGVDGAKKALIAQLNTIEKKIAQLEATLRSCEGEIGQGALSLTLAQR